MNPARLLVLLVTLPLFFGGCKEKDEGVSFDELQDRGLNGYFEKNQEIGYTGKVYQKYSDGQFKMKGQLIKGKWSGLKEEWYENGQKKYIEEWKNGSKDGLWEKWYKDQSFFTLDGFKDLTDWVNPKKNKTLYKYRPRRNKVA